ncbi:hypothetical protein STEG23_033456, partial [Scotinomys teguina]
MFQHPDQLQGIWLKRAIAKQLVNNIGTYPSHHPKGLLQQLIDLGERRAFRLFSSATAYGLVAVPSKQKLRQCGEGKSNPTSTTSAFLPVFHADCHGSLQNPPLILSSKR